MPHYDASEGEFIDFETLDDWKERDEKKDAEIARLTAERDAMARAALETAARAASEYLTTGGFYQAERHAFTLRQHISALTPADAKAALDARDRAKVAEGLRMAAEIAQHRRNGWLNAGGFEGFATGGKIIADAILSRAKDMEAGNG